MPVGRPSPSCFRVASRWLRSTSLVLWHGTGGDFKRPQRRNGVLWLAFSPHVASRYGHSLAAVMWRVTLKPSAKIVDLRDLNDPVSRAFYAEYCKWGHWRDIGEGDFLRLLNYSTIENEKWALPFLMKRVDGVVVPDDTTSALPVTYTSQNLQHLSIALLDPSAVESFEKMTEEEAFRSRMAAIGEVGTASRWALRRTAGYYDWTPPTPLEEVVRRWQEDGDKLYEPERGRPHMLPLQDVWEHREYTWTRQNARPGGMRVRGRSARTSPSASRSTSPRGGLCPVP